MSGDNNDDFWNQKSDDNFWNEPISYTNSNNGQEKSKTEQEKKIKTTNPFQDNPYVQNEYFENTYAENTYSDASGIKEKSSKSLSAHAIVRLIFVIATVLIGIILFSGTKLYEKVIQKDILTQNIQEYSNEKSFITNRGNQIIMPAKAYTVLEADSMMGLPAGEKMILVPFENVEGNCKGYDYGYRLNCYIRYEDKLGMIYKLPLIQRNYYPFLLDLELPKQQMLSSGGISYYYNHKGFYSFFVSDKVDSVDFIVEETRRKYSVYLTDCIHCVSIEIEEADKQDLQAIFPEDNEYETNR